jgi:c-di-GMP-binding flagellar brake protein YcgR
MASGDERTGIKKRPDGMERRLHERADTDQLIVVRTGTGEVVGELLDISAAGAKLRIREGLCPAVNDAVSIVLLDQTELTGTISRVDETSIGFSFDIKLLQPSEYLHHDHLGFDFYRAIQALQAKRVVAN